MRRQTGTAAVLAVVALAAAGCGGSGQGGEGEDVVLDFAWWGDETRAERYEQAVALFEEQNPGVDVRTSYASFSDYWTARNTEAAGGALPDVIQMDVAYLAEYSLNGQVAPLDEHLGETIDVSEIPESLLPSVQVDGQTTAIPTSTNTLGTLYNADTMDALGLDIPEDGPLSWDDYDALLTDIAEAGAEEAEPVYGASNYTTVFWLFQIWLAQQGKALFDGEGGLGFDEADLAEWWGRAEPLYESGAFVPQQQLDQIEGADAIGLGVTASETSWDNFLVRFSEGAGGAEMVMVPPPADDPDERGLFLKASLMLSMASNTDHPEEAASFIDFIVNDPEVGEIFGMSRGVPASSAALEGWEAEGLDAQILEYEQSVQDYVSPAPPPAVGFGTMEAEFARIAEEIGHGAVTVDEGVDQWFELAEAAMAG
ncbi:ABC transporter substrate-binding protein [Myceligenerans pegani]|uniref:Extracellular solute-binding protein n=1 Tax=Myceligenerans pegani TaxID=2776917 RepID=A0ABR9N513_9MICO|nr:extracellular solute-binding protein [Myceligenerans sp. TRM 65318]MBE1878749.1 extracellular solute-binding protein [Myceligenerans sp. TRM 65318]MBE3021020.1 extracellular solute-binding protein [Myceligenerans sp. TRM 65318]